MTASASETLDDLEEKQRRRHQLENEELKRRIRRAGRVQIALFLHSLLLLIAAIALALASKPVDFALCLAAAYIAVLHPAHPLRGIFPSSKERITRSWNTTSSKSPKT